MTKAWDAPSVAELRERFDTYPEKIKDLSMRLVNEARLVQSSVSGLQHVPVEQVLPQVADLRLTLDAIGAALADHSDNDRG